MLLCNKQFNMMRTRRKTNAALPAESSVPKPLPPLNALRAFEAAARHRSMRDAALELHVTPAAVSQQVKSLEDYLGVQLFRRAGRGLILTAEAQASVARLREGFDALAGTTEFEHIQKRIVGLCQSGQRSAFAEGCHITGDLYSSEIQQIRQF